MTTASPRSSPAPASRWAHRTTCRPSRSARPGRPPQRPLLARLCALRDRHRRAAVRPGGRLVRPGRPPGHRARAAARAPVRTARVSSTGSCSTCWPRRPRSDRPTRRVLRRRISARSAAARRPGVVFAGRRTPSARPSPEHGTQQRLRGRPWAAVLDQGDALSDTRRPVGRPLQAVRTRPLGGTDRRAGPARRSRKRAASDARRTGRPRRRSPADRRTRGPPRRGPEPRAGRAAGTRRARRTDRVAAEREHTLGPDHPDTLGSRYEVGVSLEQDRPYRRSALREFGRVAEGRERVPSARTTRRPSRPARRRPTSWASSAGTSRRTRSYAAVLASRERTMGPDHPDTLRCRHKLAFNLSRLGRLEDSYRLAGEVADARCPGRSAPTHPDTLVSQYEVAYALGRLGRWPEALAGYRRGRGRPRPGARPRPPRTRSPPATRSASASAGSAAARRPWSSTAPWSTTAPVSTARTAPGDPARPARPRVEPRPARPLGGGPRRVPRGHARSANVSSAPTTRTPSSAAARSPSAWAGWAAGPTPWTCYRQVAEAREHVLGADPPGHPVQPERRGALPGTAGPQRRGAALHRRVAALRARGARESRTRRLTPALPAAVTPLASLAGIPACYQEPCPHMPRTTP